MIKGLLDTFKEWILKHERFRSFFESHHPPDYLVRGVMWGSFISMTPTFGMQMPLVTVLWIFLRPFGRLNFNLPVGLAMTWVTNYLTILPYYFISYITGIKMMGLITGAPSVMSYQSFVKMWNPVMNSPFPDILFELIKVFGQIGMVLFLGTLPYALITSILLTWTTAKLLRIYRSRKSNHFGKSPDENEQRRKVS